MRGRAARPGSQQYYYTIPSPLDPHYSPVAWMHLEIGTVAWTVTTV